MNDLFIAGSGKATDFEFHVSRQIGELRMRSVFIRNFSYVAVIALGTIGSSVAPASAHYVTTRCDRDGDSCYRVVCDDDGDDCRRVSSYSRYDYDRRYNYNRRSYGGSYWNGYGSGTGFGLFFNNGSDGRYNNYPYRGYENEEEEEENE